MQGWPRSVSGPAFVQCILAVLLLLLLININCANGCGISTHNVIAHRAASWFVSTFPDYAQIIKNQQGAFQNGAAFPDFGYGCPLKDYGYPRLPDMSEAAHWPPFQRAFVDYFNQYYQRPYSDKAEKLIAFLLGVVSHSVADLIWHDLVTVGSQTQQGFIQALAEADYYVRDASYSGIQHTKADVGGEFMAAYEGDLNFMTPESWYLPSDDLAAIFNSSGLHFKFTEPWVIEACNELLFLEAVAIKDLVGKYAYPNAADNSPWMVDSYQDYWLGGVNDMAAWTSDCWPYVINWFETGNTTDICYLEVGVTNAINPQERIKLMQRYYTELHEKLAPSMATMKVDKKRANGGVQYSVDRNPLTKDASPKVVAEVAGDVRASECITEHGSGTNSSITFTIDQEYALLGSILVSADLNNDGMDDLLIGAPGAADTAKDLGMAGKVFLVYGTKNVTQGNQIVDLSQNSKGVVTFMGTHSNGRYGSAIAVLDFNLDGVKDVVISAPGVGASDLGYRGEVHVYFGTNGGNTFSSTPDYVISSQEHWSNLGYTLTTCDVSGDGHDDLIIGSPFAAGPARQSNWNRYYYQIGSVSIFAASNARVAGGRADWKSNADWFEQGEPNAYSWFGRDIACIPLANSNNPSNSRNGDGGPGGTLLLVGAAESANQQTATPAVGKLYGFVIAPNFSSSKLMFSVVGEAEFDKLGYSIAVGSPYPDQQTYVAVSMPTKGVPHNASLTVVQTGVVSVFALSTLMNAGIGASYTSLPKALTLRGDTFYDRFGWKVMFNDLNKDGMDDLWISEPHYDSYYGTDAGVGYLWMGGKAFPRGTVKQPRDSADACLEGSHPQSLYTQSAVFLDFDGDGKMDIVTGGPRDSAGLAHAGSATLLYSAFS